MLALAPRKKVLYFRKEPLDIKKWFRDAENCIFPFVSSTSLQPLINKGNADGNVKEMWTHLFPL